MWIENCDVFQSLLIIINYIAYSSILIFKGWWWYYQCLYVTHDVHDVGDNYDIDEMMLILMRMGGEWVDVYIMHECIHSYA